MSKRFTHVDGCDCITCEYQAEIDELKAKLAIALEALNDVKCEAHSSLCESMKPYRPSYCCHREYAEEALAKIKGDTE